MTTATHASSICVQQRIISVCITNSKQSIHDSINPPLCTHLIVVSIVMINYTAVILGKVISIQLLAGLAFGSRPNVIIMQPDDLQFYDEWNPPPNNPTQAERTNPLPSTNGLPNINRLRTDGLHMKQAYTVSPTCGTSRYSTM